MIDTIVLLLTPDMFQLIDPDKFLPSSAWALQKNTAQPFAQSKQNPTKRELRAGIYKPRLTLSSRIANAGPTLKIEVSLPKLLFGNNFTELRYKDFEAVLSKLATSLQSMGISASTEMLEQAPVASIHYAKNIALTDGSIPYHYINKIREANIKLSLDTNKTDYRNEGHSFKWHCNAYEVVFYDKIRDLEKGKTSSKRALEKDNELQISLCNHFSKRKKFEVLRMEIRLNKRTKMKQLFAKLGIKAELTFKKLFKPAISKKILLHYFYEIEKKRPPILDYKAANNRALLIDLAIHNPELSPKKILQIYGLKLALDGMNLRELRAIFAKHPSASFNRLLKDLEGVELTEIRNPLRKIRQELERFKPLIKHT